MDQAIHLGVLLFPDISVSMTAAPKGDHNLPSGVEVRTLLHGVLENAERHLCAISRRQSTVYHKKVDLMSFLTTSRILFARFLALYRWKLSQRSVAICSNALSIQNQAYKSTLGGFKNIRKIWRRSKAPLAHPWNHPVSLDQHRIHVRRKTVAVLLVSDCVSSRITRAQYSHKALEVIAPREFYVKIRISAYGRCSVERFSVVWPKSVRSCMPVKFVNYLESVVSCSRHVLNDVDVVLHRLYLKGLFLKAYQDLTRLSSVGCFVLKREANEVRLIFACSSSPSHEFVLKTLESGIALMSCGPLVRPHEGIIRYPGNNSCNDKNFMSYLLTSDAGELDSVVDDIRRSVYYTRLHRLWEFIVAGMMTISMKSFRATFEETQINIFLFQTIVCSVELNQSTGDTVVNTFGGMGADPDSFIEALQGCECQRNDVIKAIFTHALAKLIFDCVLGNHVAFQFKYYSESLRHCTTALNFSFAPDFVVLFGERDGRPFISTRSRRRPLIVFTREIVLLQNASETDVLNVLHEAVLSAKISTLVLQCEETLRDNGIIGTIENSKIHFLVEPFDCVEFEIERNLSWSLTFIKPAASMSDTIIYRFIGNEIGIRFTDWILNMVSGVAAYTQMVRQMLGIRNIHTAIATVEFHDETEFRTVLSPSYCSSIYVTYSGVELICRSRTGRVTYNMHPGLSPRITFDFGRNMELKPYFVGLTQNRIIEQTFASVLNGACLRLMKLFHVFTEGPHNKFWRLSLLHDNHPFFLIYRGSYTLNISLKAMSFFQVHIPDGKSALLQIPLEARSAQGQALPILRFNADNLERLRDSIESFSQIQIELSEIGFCGFQIRAREVVCPFPKSIPGVTITCVLHAKSVEFEVDGNNEAAKLLKALLNFNYNDVHTQILIARFVKNLLEFDTRFVAFVLQVTLRALDKTAVLGINWRHTMELTAITSAESKVIFSFTTDTGNAFCLEITRREGEQAPEVVGFDRHGSATRMKSMKDIVRWLSDLEHIE